MLYIFIIVSYTEIVSATRLFRIAVIRVEIDISYRFVLPQHQSRRVHNVYEFRVCFVKPLVRFFAGV